MPAGGVMVVDDATKDPLFAGNPYVTGEGHERFYAGTLLTTANGHNLGFLCNDRPATNIGDAARLREVLLNFFSTAIKFTERGEASAMVRRGMRPDRRLMMRVDESTTRRFGGTGRGLAISRRLIEMTGGKVGVDCVVGQRSTFWFECPLNTGAVAA